MPCDISFRYDTLVSLPDFAAISNTTFSFSLDVSSLRNEYVRLADDHRIGIHANKVTWADFE